MNFNKRYYVAHFVTDLYSQDDEYEMFYADSKEAVEQEIQKVLGEHLLVCEVRKATWAERRQMRRAHYRPCIVC